MGLDIKIRIDRGTSTEIDAIANDHWLALLALHIDAGRITRDDLIVSDLHLVLRPSLNHDTARLKMLKVAPLDRDVCVDGDNTCCSGAVSGVTLELAVFHLDFGAVQYGDAWDLTIGLTEDSTIDEHKTCQKADKQAREKGLNPLQIS